MVLCTTQNIASSNAYVDAKGQHRAPIWLHWIITGPPRTWLKEVAATLRITPFYSSSFIWAAYFCLNPYLTHILSIWNTYLSQQKIFIYNNAHHKNEETDTLSYLWFDDKNFEVGPAWLWPWPYLLLLLVKMATSDLSSRCTQLANSKFTELVSAMSSCKRDSSLVVANEI